MHGTRGILCITVFIFLAMMIAPALAGASTAVGDSVYSAHHPSIMFTAGDVPALRAKVGDGGHDDDAYDLIYSLVHSTYANWGPGSFLINDYGLQTIPNLGLVAWVEEPIDTAAMNMGRVATLYLATQFAPNYDEAGTGLRLRSLVLGYDLFFGDATEAERQTVLDEIVQYLGLVTQSLQYDLFAYRPYLGNHSAMFAGPLGMAAVSLRGQVSDALLDGALADADRICERLFLHQTDPLGSYKEGALYGLWTMKNLVFYFDARKRYDGYNYGDHAAIRGLERWLAFELLPEGRGYTNNLNDSNYATLPFTLNTSYFDWAIHEWDSGLSAWLWEHVAGEYGLHRGSYADNAATVLWHRPIAQAQPDSIMPNHALWLDRGLYYYRSGWQSGVGSNDVVFSFFSGKFHGGHAQEDQNQFTLYAYGDKYAIDHGSGSAAKQSEAHNMVFIDGAGQHNAGSSVGTDGEIVEYMLGDFADYVVGDATAAYSTYSEFNANGFPYPELDWSWGHTGANPVLSARRRVLVVHGPNEPYFVVIDDINKDANPHLYQWRLHTRDSNVIDTSGDPITIDGDSSSLDIFALNPPRDTLSATVSAFNNQSPEPDSQLLSLSTTAVDPRFSFLMLPHPDPAAPAAVTRTPYPWGEVIAIDRGGGTSDVLVFNPDGVAVTHGLIATDASLAALRTAGNTVVGFFALDMISLEYDGTIVAECSNGPMTCSLYDGVIDLGRYDAAYRVIDMGVERVRYRGQKFGFVVDGQYVVSDGVTAVEPPAAPAPRLDVSAYPNPFNPATTIRVHSGLNGPLSVEVYDVTGRRVRTLWHGPIDGVRHLTWDGRDDSGQRVASGAYLVRAHTGTRGRAAKVILLK